MESTEYTIEIFVNDDGKSSYQSWFDGLNSKKAQSRIDARLARVRKGNFGDHKNLGGGISELRFAFGPGHRIYFATVGTKIILLLAGGGKGSQSKDIESARILYADYLGGIEDG